MKKIFALFAAAIFACGAACAKETSKNGPDRFYDSDDFTDSVGLAAYVLARDMGTPCSKDFSTRPTAAYKGPGYQEDQDGRPTGKSPVMIKGEARGCPFDTFVAVLVPNPKSNSGPLMPKTAFAGDTNAGFQLMFDTMQTAFPAVIASMSCESAKLEKMAVTKAPSGKLPAWTEVWTFKGCGKTLGAEINFQTDAKGETDFAVKLR